MESWKANGQHLLNSWNWERSFGYAAVNSNRPPGIFRTRFKPALLSSLRQLPQCLCIHLQRLTWSNEGTPIKRQEHVQFTEYLSMDRYKHNGSTQRGQSTKCAPSPLKAENSDVFLEKATANGMVEYFSGANHFWYFYFAITRIVFLIIQQVSIAATTTTNLLRMEPAHLYFSTQTQTSALPAIIGKR